MSNTCKTCIYFDRNHHCGKHVTFTEPSWRCSSYLIQDNRTAQEVEEDIAKLEHDIKTQVHGQHPVDLDPVHGDRTSLLESTFGLSTPDLLGIYKIDSSGNLEDTSGPMTIEKYNAAIDEQITRCKTLLTSKRGEYATDVNPLNNFNRAGDLLYKTPVGALSGMMAKHTISVYDMMNDHEKGVRFNKDKWDEKITDHINYLLILQAILEDERG